MSVRLGVDHRSMATQDGNLFPKKSNGTYARVACSRWDELGESLRWHGETVRGQPQMCPLRCLDPYVHVLVLPLEMCPVTC